MTTATLAVLDGTGASQAIPAETGTVSGVATLTPHSQPEVAGAPVSAANPMPVLISGAVTGASPTSFQQVMTLSAAALAAYAYSTGIVLKALLTNTGTIFVGGSGTTSGSGYPLTAGESISYAINNTDLIYVIGTNTTDVVAVTGT